MKLKHTNNDEIEINESGLPGILAGVVVIVVGGGMAILPVLQQGTPWWWSLIGIAIACAGVFVAVSAASRHIVLRKNGECSIVETKVLTRKEKVQTFQSDQIVTVGLESATSYERGAGSQSDDMRRVRTSVLYVALRDNSQIIIATKKSGSSSSGVNGINLASFGKAPLSDEAQQLANFFGVPLNSQEAVSGNSVGQIVGAVRNEIAKQAAVEPEPAPTVNATVVPEQPLATPPASTSVATPLQPAAPATSQPQPPAQTPPSSSPQGQ